MSRAGYCDDGWDFEQWNYIMHRGAVTSAFRGKRGQLFLLELLAALDRMPVKRLIAHELVETDYVTCSHWGLHETESVCAIGAVGKRRGVDMSRLDPEDYHTVAGTFGVAEAMAREIVYINDEGGNCYHTETPEQRYERIHAWVRSQIREFSL